MTANYSHGKKNAKKWWNILGSVILIIIILGSVGILVNAIIKDIQSGPKPNIFIERHAPWLIPQTKPEILGVYICTDENYNPANYRVTRKSLSRTFNGGKTWKVLWELKKDSPKSIVCVKACRCRSSREELPPGHRDIILFVKEKH
jgi:hypothetical protein